MKPGLRACLPPLCAIALLAACAAAPEPAMTTSLIDQAPADIARAAPGDAVLLVLRPRARGVYDTRAMAYRTEAHQVAYYRDHQWGEPPGDMLLPLLVRSLEASGAFRTVATPPYAGPAPYALDTELVELLQDYTANPPLLRLTLRVRLDGAARPLAAREFRVEEAMPARSPRAGVAAANAATARMLREVAAFVAQAAP